MAENVGQERNGAQRRQMLVDAAAAAAAAAVDAVDSTGVQIKQRHGATCRRRVVDVVVDATGLNVAVTTSGSSSRCNWRYRVVLVMVMMMMSRRRSSSSSSSGRRVPVAAVFDGVAPALGASVLEPHLQRPRRTRTNTYIHTYSFIKSCQPQLKT